MRVTNPVPPRLAERLVARLTSDARWREVVLGDLAEEFVAAAERRSLGRARLWYWRQALALVPRRLADPFRSFFETTGGSLVNALLKEAGFAVRSLRQQPLVTGIILLTLALGLGSNAATFGMIDRLFIRPFQIPDVDRLVVIAEQPPNVPQQFFDGVSLYRFLEWRDQATVATNLVAYAGLSVNFAGGDEPERLDGQRVTAGYLTLLGARPALGRDIARADETTGQHRRVVLGDALWRRRFSADPAVVGRPIRLDGDTYEVIGVAPRGFEFPNGSQLWVPFDAGSRDAAGRSTRFGSAIAALPAAGDLERARAQVAAFFARQQSDNPEIDRRRFATVWNFRDAMVEEGLQRVLKLWQAAALLVLLIGCTNIASLLLARGAERQRDLAVRLALGASRGQLVRQLLVESVVLAAAAVPLALGVAWAVFELLHRSMPAALIRYVSGWTSMGVDTRVVLFTVVAAFVTSVIFGLLPALSSSRVAPTATLREGGRSVTGGGAPSRLRRALVVVEIALALPLLVASGMAALAGQRLAYGPQGYNPDGVFQMRTLLPPLAYPDAAAQRQFAERLLDAVTRTPGVENAGITTVLPSNTSNMQRQISIDGLADDRANPRVVSYRAVSAGYFETMGMTVVSGRTLGDQDREDGQPVSIVTESLARLYFPDGSPLGRRIRIGTTGDNWTTVVGVSRDTIDDWLVGRHRPTMYVPFAQFPNASVNLAARTTGDPAALADGLRRALAGVDPLQPAYATRPVREQLFERTTGLRFLAGVMAAFGFIALVLATFGIYGVMAHSVVQRRHEFGVRMALGASRRDVLALTVRQGVTLTAIGVTLGLTAAVALARVIESSLLGVVASEVSLFAAITTGLILIALIATVVPASRATRLDPAVVLKE